MAQATDLIAGFRIFDGFSPGELALIAGTARPATFAARQRVFSEGEPAHGCWLIREGSIALDVTVPGRGQVVVQTLGHGDVVGWSWLVPPYTWHLGATAVRPTTATELDTTALRALADSDPKLGYALALSLFGLVLHRLEATRARLLDLYGSNGDTR